MIEWVQLILITVAILCFTMTAVRKRHLWRFDPLGVGLTAWLLSHMLYAWRG